MALRSALRLTPSRRPGALHSALAALRLGHPSAGALASSALKAGGCRAFMSTRSSRPDGGALFAEPSFPMPAAEDPALWLEKYARPDPADMWKVGSFPLLDDAELVADSVDLESDEQVLASPADLWDTAGMLSALGEGQPLRDADAGANVDGLLRELDGYLADSVLKKRRKKMNKHKHRKRKKALRMRTKKN